MCAHKTRRHSWFASPRICGAVIIVALFTFGVGATAVIEHFGWDLKWAGAFYTSGSSSGGWSHAREQPWRFLYDYGEIPGVLLLLGALGGYGAAKAGKIRQSYMAPCLIVILTIVLGPGIFVNGMFKNYWGRPRPVDVAVFNGPWEYREISQPGIAGRGKSFPCGHCSMAFALASGVAFFPCHATIAATALVGGIAYGLVMGVARIVQGGHFPSDVLWSGILVLMIITALYYLVFRIPETSRNGAPARLPKPQVRALFTAFVLLPALLFLFQWPVYEEVRIPVDVPAGVDLVVLDVTPSWTARDMLSPPFGAQVEVRIIKRGLGARWARISESFGTRMESSVLHISYKAQPKGFFWEWSAQATLSAPAE